MSVRGMIKRELEKRLKKHRHEVYLLVKDLHCLRRARYLTFFVFIGTGWKAKDQKIHLRARGELKNVMRAAMEEFNRKNGKEGAAGKYVCIVEAILPNGIPVFIPEKFFIPYLKKYGKPS